MTPNPLHVPQTERGVLRVFTAQLSRDDSNTLLDDSARMLRQLLGAPDLNPALVSVVQIADLGDLGLAGYLADGHDVPEATLEADAAQLAALTGTVLVVPSEALSATGGTLHPAPGVSMFGVYLSADAAPASLWPAASMEKGTATAPVSRSIVPPARKTPAGPIVILAVVLVIALVWWLA